MRTFRCTCGARLFFENTRCLTCQRELGFLPDILDVVPLVATEGGAFSTPHGDYVKCSNYADQGVCSWMVPVEAGQIHCQACRLNHVIPDLSQPENRDLWGKMELAKRRLIYSLNRLRLPTRSKQEDPQTGLAFDIKAPVGATGVVTGHEEGLITLSLAEASSVERERVRLAMKEGYRTLLGHFRHEIGHYYWDLLVRDSSALSSFRDLFGDERQDYAEALKRHYARERPTQDDAHISDYAAAHPWEDFAETFAHYLHLTDTLETATEFGFSSDPSARTFEPLMERWLELSVALNSLNRSMGLPDAYPFAVSSRVSAKLEFIHELIRGQAQAEPLPAS